MRDGKFPATVIKVIDKYRIVIDRGYEDGVRLGQRFQIFEETDELLQDPVTFEGLGNLELPKGTGQVIYVKERWATIESDRKTAPLQRIVKRKRTDSVYGTALSATIFAPEEVIEEITETPSEPVPFDSPSKGDKVKPI